MLGEQCELLKAEYNVEGEKQKSESQEKVLSLLLSAFCPLLYPHLILPITLRFIEFVIGLVNHGKTVY